MENTQVKEQQDTKADEPRPRGHSSSSLLPPIEDEPLPFTNEEWHETLPDSESAFEGPSDKRKHSHAHITPHQGSLSRIDTSDSSPLTYRYTIEIVLETSDCHLLWFERQELELMSRVFSILDTESRGLIDRAALQEFVTLRCPVFWRRDEDLRKLMSGTENTANDANSPTFDEMWIAVTQCSKKKSGCDLQRVQLGVEGWMVFCRFIALAQYLEAKRQFSARHLQQTMRHRNSPRGSEMVVVDVPPPNPPTPVTASELAEYERNGCGPLPLPELDLDHSLVAAHDTFRRPSLPSGCAGSVSIAIFGSDTRSSRSFSTQSSCQSSPGMDFAVTFTPRTAERESIVVRRSFADMSWLNDTFTSHKVLGGTLCGRILPPFPGAGGSSLASHQRAEDGSLATAISSKSSPAKAAVAGVDIIASAAKSIWGSYLSSKPPAPQASGQVAASLKNGQKLRSSLSLPESYNKPDSPTWKARQLERYLNYLLEHPALSTSFPLNTILKASQSGLEAAKLSIGDHAKSSKQSKSIVFQLVEGKLPNALWSQDAKSQSLSSLSWVRTAAQAAVALKVHGMLETTGLPSASARLQHASLPAFDNSISRQAAWADEENSRDNGRSPRHYIAEDQLGVDDTECFEHGVVHVDSELNREDGVGNMDKDGYDLLPLPVPAPERRILCAGSVAGEGPLSRASVVGCGNQCSRSGLEGARLEPKHPRFHYGTAHRRERLDSGDSSQVQRAFLGEFSVDDNIDKLREVIGSVGSTLSRCLAASASAGDARRKRLALHLDLVRGLDSWEGMRGQFITQRSLLSGVSGLEESRDLSERSDLDIVDDIAWQTSLARSAVSAAEDVRSTVRAARTASSAKGAADAAAFAAQGACETGQFSTIDEARAAQTRSSVAQSNAIHATVIEHEANTAKKRAALALAHDVKSWNVHRKRELLRICLVHAHSQLLASRRAVDAWSCLRDGYLGSAPMTFTENKRTDSCAGQEREDLPALQDNPGLREEDASTFVYAGVACGVGDATGKACSEPSIIPVEHNSLALPQVDSANGAINTLGSESDGIPFAEELANTRLEFPNEDEIDATSASVDGNVLSASMQSLVDGLMAWGGQYDAEEDMKLPTGMAASIAFEECGAFEPRHV